MKYQIVSAKQGAKLDVAPRLKFPEDFHGSTQVDHLVKFGPAFAGLIGKHDESLPKTGVMILEHHFDAAKKLMDQINDLAQQIIANQTKYDDIGFCREYFDLAKAGYRMLDKYEPVGIPTSLERAGLVTTRLALGLDQDVIVDNEVAVVTKRTHLIGEPETNLSVTVQWRDREKLKTIDGQKILLSDFVNPASGASGLAFVVAAKELGFKPKAVNHRSISLTRQGVSFVRKALLEMGIESTFYSVGECRELNSMYYLIGDRAVADAGHALRHFLPEWYKI
ncbi:hypothetical protein A3E73_00305 [Candidatus Beckwithbacteria bacterium RIFCSPHIGHO2_12_FULL_47_17]|uniref:Uncharacterized protein n=1 Tax=Candidatus Beckwithbacteria bacterium RIFCSPHIGHO2_12_FULL_47_17 TaxID=1797460 RepID=A0A1F5DKZ1_9BACT|nr:MAG: hypothetical protein A3E73_00305 [Candidatus Beckwithbacteria bacterium RIFCSPHIGHO2_12_FULL_47_17]